MVSNANILHDDVDSELTAVAVVAVVVATMVLVVPVVSAHRPAVHSGARVVCVRIPFL